MTSNNNKDVVDIEVLVDLEQQFYDVGYEDGLEHGKIHGRIEGKQLGKEKGFEMWEEMGFYEGFAKLWRAASEHKEGKDSRVFHTSEVLLDLIAQFPTRNPAQADPVEVDIPRLFNQIRSRYKMLCAFVGVKPSLRATLRTQQESDSTAAEDGGALVVPSKRQSVWTVNDAESSQDVDFSF